MIKNYKEKLKEIFDYSIVNNSFNKATMVCNAKNVCVFGLGTYFREAFVSKKIKEKYHVNILSDNNSQLWGNVIEGLPVISPDSLLDYEDLVVIIMMGNSTQVEEQLTRLGIKWVIHNELSVDAELGFTKDIGEFKRFENQIIDAVDLYDSDESKEMYVETLANRMAQPLATKHWEDFYSEGEYFDIDILPLSDNEFFVGCGAYDGDTIDKFIHKKPLFGHIWAFEIDYGNYEKCLNKFSDREDISIINKGVWDENTDISYSRGDGENDPDEGISIYKGFENGNSKVAQVVRLNDELAGQKITYIQMDIEGSELRALHGAEQIIKTQKPKLAICLYHNTSDFWNIPKYIKELNPNYKLYLRHHYPKFWGSVLYAVCD